MGIFDNDRDRLEAENKILRALLASKTEGKQKKQVFYQCRYCGYRSVRNATDGAPLPGMNNCPRHPRGVHKGPHSWMRTYL